MVNGALGQRAPSPARIRVLRTGVVARLLPENCIRHVRACSVQTRFCNNPSPANGGLGCSVRLLPSPADVMALRLCLLQGASQQTCNAQACSAPRNSLSWCCALNSSLVRCQRSTAGGHRGRAVLCRAAVATKPDPAPTRSPGVFIAVSSWSHRMCAISNGGAGCVGASLITCNAQTCTSTRASLASPVRVRC